MRLRADQLEADLRRELRPVYLVSGDETLLVQESADAIRAAARARGFGERLILHADAQFDWQQLIAAGQAMSLFAERQLIDLRLPSGKPGDAGGKALQAYCSNPDPDKLLLITTGKLGGDSTRTRWYKAVDSAGAVLQVWPVASTELPRWLEQRLRRAGLRAEPAALQLLADRVQGNLLAAAQEVDRLALLCEDGRIDEALVTGSVGDSARFDAFLLPDRALAGDPAGSLRCLQGLRAEGTEIPVVLWALARDLRLLLSCAEGLARGAGIERLLDAQRVHERRKPLLRQAVRRIPVTILRQLLKDAAAVDSAFKGGDGAPWRLLEQLVLTLAGVRLHSTCHSAS